MLFTSVSPPVDFSVMSSLRTQANVKTCKLLRNAPPTQSGRRIQPQPANSAKALVSLYLLCRVWMQSGAVQSLHHSQASVSLPVNPSGLYLDAPGGFTADPCVFFLAPRRARSSARVSSGGLLSCMEVRKALVVSSCSCGLFALEWKLQK